MSILGDDRAGGTLIAKKSSVTLIEEVVDYATALLHRSSWRHQVCQRSDAGISQTRKQFGVPIGTFQRPTSHGRHDDQL
jgi:hypothetical protein